MKKTRFNVIGLMSGSSVDGLDVVHCTFDTTNNNIHHTINHAHTYEYDNTIKQRLHHAESLSALQFVCLDRDLGILWGNNINDFITLHNITHTDFIASHGHTIFHQPQAGITTQIGNAAHIKAITGISIISDFRSLDVALGGNGAPLVPIGDMLLFSQFDACINIGGFANISHNQALPTGNTRIAYDITPANILLNHYASQLGKEFDRDGEEASIGNINTTLLAKLSNIEYYTRQAPKSLGKEYVMSHFIPTIDTFHIPINDKLATISELIANQITRSINLINTPPTSKQILFTGGGTHNKNLIKRITQLSTHKIIIPDTQTINYKEALIFALLGVLRHNNLPNCLQSVTGSSLDNCGGTIL